MKGLEKIPSHKALQKAYEKIYLNEGIQVSQIAKWSQWVRFDPRLGEILINYIEKNWKEINPVSLNKVLLKSPWPAAFGVLLSTLSLKLKLKGRI